MDLADVEKAILLGKQLGYKDEDLKQWVELKSKEMASYKDITYVRKGIEMRREIEHKEHLIELKKVEIALDKIQIDMRTTFNRQQKQYEPKEKQQQNNNESLAKNRSCLGECSSSCNGKVNFDGPTAARGHYPKRQRGKKNTRSLFGQANKLPHAASHAFLYKDPIHRSSHTSTSQQTRPAVPTGHNHRKPEGVSAQLKRQ